MKLHADKADRYTITAYGQDWVAVNGERHQRSLLLSATDGPRPWDCADFDELRASHFDQLLAQFAEPPELVLLGSGSRLRFVHPSLLTGLIRRRIGVETMDTGAACRTYNILAGEGRRVLAALLLGD
ncbi:MAG: Mth938-like domain-containing protein [Hydrogenophaga sp.]